MQIDPQIKNKLKAAYDALAVTFPPATLEERRQKFIARFGLAVLQGALKDDKAILEFFLGGEDRKGLYYHLERETAGATPPLGQDFGSVLGGSARKFYVWNSVAGYKRVGAGNQTVSCTEAEAIAEVRRVAHTVLLAAMTLTKYDLSGSDPAAEAKYAEAMWYSHLAAPLGMTPEADKSVLHTGWVHKYIAMLSDALSYHHRSVQLFDHLQKLTGVAPPENRWLAEFAWRRLFRDDPDFKDCSAPVLMKACYQLLQTPTPAATGANPVQARPRQYWALQANPTIYRIEDAIAELDTDTWGPDRSTLLPGDRVIMWKSKGVDAHAGIVGLAEVTKEVAIRPKTHDEYFLDSKDYEGNLPRIEIRYVRSAALPLWKEDLPAVLQDLTVAKGTQGNVFVVTPQQWEALMTHIGGWHDDSVPVPLPLANAPLNQILYGPPGTGKTFNTIIKAAQLLTDGNITDMEDARPNWDELRRDGCIEFVTFHQSYGYEDFIEGLRPALDEDAEQGVRYQIKDGALKRIALRALGAMLEPIPATAATPARVPFEVLWERLEQELETDPDRVYPGLTDASAYHLTIGDRGSIQAVNLKSQAANRQFSSSRDKLELVFNAFRDTHDQVTWGQIKNLLVVHGHHHITGMLFRELKRIEKQIAESPTPLLEDTTPLPAKARAYLRTGAASGYQPMPEASRPRYVLVMDEINRGNISRIFGELITLIEDDKRVGEPVALDVTLPLSGERFALPPNLYLLGTMNTADKSIALVDIALRRRFEFEEMMPDFAVCPGLNATMRTVLGELNRRITLYKDRDHQIGHAYFMKVASAADFDREWRRRIRPLLSEYFYNDWDGLRVTLGETGAAGRLVRSLGGDTRTATQFEWRSDEEVGSTFDALRANYKVGAGGLAVVESIPANDDTEATDE